MRFPFIFALAAVFVPGVASAEFNWCSLTPAFVARDFDQTVAAIRQVGCQEKPSDTAHFRSWSCDDLAKNDTLVFAERDAGQSFVSALPSRDIMPAISTCPGVSSASEQFESTSLAFRGRAELRYGSYGLSRKSLFFYELGGFRALGAGGVTDSAATRYLEAAFYGYRRPSYVSSSAEIAGKRIYGTRMSEIMAALRSRGSAIVKERSLSSGAGRQVNLTAPVGLEGVTDIEIFSVGEHVRMVRYTLGGTAAYGALIEALDEKYGRSTRTAWKGCTLREWSASSASAVKIVGQHCADGSHVWFENQLVKSQMEAFGEWLKETDRELPAKPSIDRDNI